MKRYKYVVPCLLAGCALLTGCKRDGIVVGKRNSTIFIDNNGDKMPDWHIEFDDSTSCVYRYVLPGDTISYYYKPAQKYEGSICTINNIDRKTIRDMVRARERFNGKLR